MKETKDRDAYESGCNGLKEGWAYIKASGQRIHASVARKKDGPFICKSCLSDAVHHFCSNKIDHFAHLARLTPIIGAHESEIHKLCKESIYEELKNKFSEHK